MFPSFVAVKNDIVGTSVGIVPAVMPHAVFRLHIVAPEAEPTPPKHMFHCTSDPQIGATYVAQPLAIRLLQSVSEKAEELPGLGSIRIWSIQVSKRPRKNGENGKNGGKWGKMGGNEGKWGEMRENGGK